MPTVIAPRLTQYSHSHLRATKSFTTCWSASVLVTLHFCTGVIIVSVCREGKTGGTIGHLYNEDTFFRAASNQGNTMYRFYCTSMEVCDLALTARPAVDGAIDVRVHVRWTTVWSIATVYGLLFHLVTQSTNPNCELTSGRWRVSCTCSVHRSTAAREQARFH